MLKLLIIDDEPIIRAGLKNVIPWNEYGYQICGTAKDGREGLDKIRLYHPDLVLLDIRMPGLSGIDLVHQVQKENINCRFIILSAYSSFDYAKELMQLGVTYYLLKPVDENELINILEQIEQERKEEQQLQDQLKLFDLMNEEKSLWLLLEGEVDRVPEEIKLTFEGKRFQVVRFSTALKEINDHWLKEQVSQYTDDIKLIRTSNNYHLIFINQTELFVHKFLEKVIERFHLYGDRDVVFLLGSAVDRIEQIHHSYKEVKELQEVHYCFSEEKVLSYRKIEKLSQGEIKHLDEIDRQKLFHYIEFRDQQNINKKLNKLEQYYQSTRYPKERIRAEIIEWCTAIIDLVKVNYPSIKVINKSSLAENIASQPNLQKVIEYLKEEMKNISVSVNKVYPSKGNIVDKITDYVHHYYYENVRLKDLADLFHYNSAYLGKIFKKETGKYFNDYLHQVRINNAKKLLESKKYKVYEISKRVGYSNSDYFYKNFKQYEGISPKEYQIRSSKNLH